MHHIHIYFYFTRTDISKYFNYIYNKEEKMKKKMIWLMLVIIGFVVIIQIYFFSSYLTQYKSIELNQMNKEAIKALYLMKDYFDKEKLTFIKNKKSTFYSFSNRDINSNKDLKNFKLTKKLLNKKFFNNSCTIYCCINCSHYSNKDST